MTLACKTAYGFDKSKDDLWVFLAEQADRKRKGKTYQMPLEKYWNNEEPSDGNDR